ncbi:MAG: hypothetical protein CM15mP74_05820 [Halieaceae bacterium]|nr:MAG: hypothetical protein CM15mP74_05820 [Halieaceae bacterium]
MISLNNIRLFNGHADHFCPDAIVVVTDGKILYAGPSEGSPIPSEQAQVIDGKGHFVMPGMVESHAHLSYTNNGPLELDKSPVEEVMIKTIHNARVMLGLGSPQPSVLVRCIESMPFSSVASNLAKCWGPDYSPGDGILARRAAMPICTLTMRN